MAVRRHPDISRRCCSLGYNLIGSVGTADFFANTTGDQYGDPDGSTAPNPGALESATTISALLGPLADNGGPTFTHALLPGSPAINAADPATTVSIDQRGEPRPAGTGFDIGAFEFQGPDMLVRDGGAEVPSGTGLVDFGLVEIGSATPRQLTIENVGVETLHIGAITVPPGFTLVNPPTSTTLAVGDSTTMDVTYDALTLGVTSGTMTIASDDPDENPYVFALNGAACEFAGVVENTNDSGPGSLRQTILDACPGSVITFDPALTAGGPTTITLTTGFLLIEREITIVGPGRDLLAISGNNAPSAFVVALTSATLEGLTVRDSNWPGGYGGGVVAIGAATLSNCTVTSNASALGGGIGVLGTLTVSDCIISSNTASAWGGGIGRLGFFADGSMMVTDSVFTGNTGVGGAICDYALLQNSHLTVDGCSFVGNQSPDFGGAIALIAYTDAVLLNSTFSGNSAKSDGGAILDQGSTTSITNVTITGNMADSDLNGSGEGGGVALGSLSCIVGNSIIAGNADGGGETPDIVGAFPSAGYNLIGSVGAQDFSGNTTGDRYGDPLGSTAPKPGAIESATAIDPLLGPLADNSGPTPTHALLAGSPALDNADPATTLTVDQRGKPRPGAAGFDIGAYEFVPRTVEVSLDGVVIPDGSGVADMGFTPQGTPLIKTFVVTNVGDEGVMLSPLNPVPAGYSIFSPIANTNLAPDTSTTFDLSLDGTAIGTASGTVQFFNTDTAHNPYDFTVTGFVCGPAITVANTNDAGPGSLRQAIADACPGAVIDFDPTLTAGGATTITLTTGQLAIGKELTILGPGADLLAVSGNNASRVFQCDTGSSVTLSDLTVRDARGSGEGGGIGALLATLTVERCVITSNTVLGFGGGIGVQETKLKVRDSVIENNLATSGAGGIDVFSPNTRGDISGSVIQGNRSVSYGGGVNFELGADGSLVDCVITDNATTGAVTFLGGGGVSMLGCDPTVRVEGCTIIGNAVTGPGTGGGIGLQGSSAAVVNSTISDNQTSASGGGAAAFSGRLRLENVTVTGNAADSDGNGTGAGGGVYADTTGTIELANTIVAGNTEPAGLTDDLAAAAGGQIRFFRLQPDRLGGRGGLQREHDWRPLRRPAG